MPITSDADFPFLRSNLTSVLTKAHNAGWSDALIAHVLHRDEEREKGQKPGAKRVQVWRWRTGDSIPGDLAPFAAWCGVSVRDLCFRDVTKRVKFSAPPDVVGIRVYRTRGLEVEAAPAVAPRPAPPAAGPEWIVPAR
jgi:hypothetical protein